MATAKYHALTVLVRALRQVVSVVSSHSFMNGICAAATEWRSASEAAASHTASSSGHDGAVLTEREVRASSRSGRFRQAIGGHCLVRVDQQGGEQPAVRLPQPIRQ